MSTLPSLTDAELLTAYGSGHDEGAFGELTRRYTPLVYRTCHRLLRDPHEAEDAAQAVFVVLGRKAGSLRQGELAPWLYRVAHHVAAETVRKRMRRTRREAAYADHQALQAGSATATAGADPAVLALIDTALRQLPARYREAVILRYFQNHSEKEAAARVGCPLGTFSSRVSKGIARLRQNLGQLGVTTSATALVGLLTAEGSAPVPPAVFAAILATAKAAAGAPSAAGSATALTLAKGTLQTLFWTKVKTAAAAVVLTAAVAVGGGLVAHQALARRAVPVTAGAPTAPASAAGLKPLSPWEAWTKELLARAAAGPGEALDSGTCSTRDENGQWFIENRVSADRRIWVTGLRGHSRVAFEIPRCRRGVLVGQMQILAADQPPAGAARVPVREREKPSPRIPANSASGYGVFLHGGGKAQWPLLGSDSLTVAVGSGSRDAERFVVYFETDANGQVTVLYAAQPVGREPLPAFVCLSHTLPGAQVAGVGIGLFAGSTPVVWYGLKIVPLGPELPAPPLGTPQERKEYNVTGGQP